MPSSNEESEGFLGGHRLFFEEADRLWKKLKAEGEISRARQVLERIRSGDALLDEVPASKRKKLCQEEAMLTSKDSELKATMRHDRALKILSTGIDDLESASLDGDAETLGIAGGIRKRRWSDLGQMEDLRKAARLYDRGARNPLGYDAYTQINAAFVDDLLAHAGDDPDVRRARAAALRQRILDELPPAADVPPHCAWFNTASRAEAHFGLRQYAQATGVLRAFTAKPDPWELETTARQLAMLAHIHQDHPLDVPEIREFFEALLPGAAHAARSAMIGKVGLALSGGGFRASFYHLGVLARLAELNVLRHVDVLSCVSGGSIVGACYWLALRRRMLDSRPLERQDYVDIVNEIIQHFTEAVAGNLREAVQPSWPSVVKRLLWNNHKGAMDPELTAEQLEKRFYEKLIDTEPPVYMHDLPFTPGDHNPALAGPGDFHPGKHNWLRANKVPVLVLNATSVNTGHAWQFTPTWMGESPWAVHEEADSIPRLEWSWYHRDEGWSMQLARAVAASASVPGVFAPLE
ncbi:MAG TPA: patatin-like phospholipase family protein, partial [Longimicrobium sp.]|nr:patatin-like phospholipase family protein [Longimicrobium sp.]